MTENLVTNTTLEKVLLQVLDGDDHFPNVELQNWDSYLRWECYVEGFFRLGEEYRLKLIQNGIILREKKARKIKEKSKSEKQLIDHDALMKEKRLLVWTANIAKIVFGILKEVPDYKVKNLPKGDNLVTPHRKLTSISKYFKGTSLKFPPFDGINVSWVL